MEWNAKFRKKSISNIKKIQINSKNGMEYMEWNAKFRKKSISNIKINSNKFKKWNGIHGMECEISEKT